MTVYGFGPGLPRPVSGRVATVQRNAQDQARSLRITTDLQPGDSGGPVIDTGGRAVAISQAIEAGAPAGVSFAVGLAGIRDDLTEHGVRLSDEDGPSADAATGSSRGGER